ncbi:MAG: bifunctional diaminohydroxyphosphoribosylaminopyrimidine deaminase/5-amino-6-(5-phosphoribosylamino)uracil reductase RibD [Candidatus Omnitrophica bacterium]|nr:bifunctional diaminohydroxyphosphoribosylaminopyrimidine deaminase/5-amino-6-(5-phosphoribosylamino)uracil reductase RibD [Candidatus Omnitrophota bacterium]
MKSCENDIYFLRKTFLLAQRAQGHTSPNPLVGAVIVKDKRIIAQGYHHKAGLPHAEIEAIRNADESIKGATLYVNLEPCCHFGRTSPCVDEIIKQGFGRVVIAMRDPNPKVNGASIKKLKHAGIKVTVGLLRDEAEKVNEVFLKNMRYNTPFVVAKVAQRLDGKIDTHRGISRWITCLQSRVYARKLRDRYDAVMVGINTVVSDDPHLNGMCTTPFKIVVDPDMRIPLNSYLIKKSAEKLIVFVSLKSKNKRKNFPSGIRIYFLKEKNGRLSLKEMLKVLYTLGITSVFVEGGSATLGRFFDEKLVDKIYFFIAPKIIGGRRALTSIGGQGYALPKTSPWIRDISVTQSGGDILITGSPVYAPLKQS